MQSPVVQEILEHNQSFVAEKEYEQYETDKYPDKKLAVVACMDVRLIELLPAALGLKNGDANIIKVAGSGVSSPFDSVMRSLFVSVCELGTEDIMVVAHTNCGAQHMSCEEMFTNMKELGVPQEAIDESSDYGFDYASWFEGFGDPEKLVRESVDIIRTHPLMPASVRVGGYLMDSYTGELTEIEC